MVIRVMKKSVRGKAQRTIGTEMVAATLAIGLSEKVEVESDQS